MKDCTYTCISIAGLFPVSVMSQGLQSQARMWTLGNISPTFGMFWMARLHLILPAFLTSTTLLLTLSWTPILDWLDLCLCVKKERWGRTKYRFVIHILFPRNLNI